MEFHQIFNKIRTNVSVSRWSEILRKSFDYCKSANDHHPSSSIIDLFQLNFSHSWHLNHRLEALWNPESKRRELNIPINWDGHRRWKSSSSQSSAYHYDYHLFYSKLYVSEIHFPPKIMLHSSFFPILIYLFVSKSNKKLMKAEKNFLVTSHCCLQAYCTQTYQHHTQEDTIH